MGRADLRRDAENAGWIGDRSEDVRKDQDYFLGVLAAGALGYLRYDIFGVWRLGRLFDMICKTADGLLWQQKGSGGMDGEAYLIGRSASPL